MNMSELDIVILGLSITSSWGNGHATTYRGLVREVEKRGHRILFLEREQPWYAEHRDMPEPPFGQTKLYESLEELKDTCRKEVQHADLVIVGSCVPEGIAVGQWAVEEANNGVAFYDIDTPETLSELENGTCTYLSVDLIPQFDLYLSFTGGPTLRRLEREFGAPLARPLHCSADTLKYYPTDYDRTYDLGYMGTYSPDRQPPLEALMLEPARQLGDYQFVVAGSTYPPSVDWPENIERIDHLPPDQHRRFYNEQRYTLNITRRNMIRAGYSPSIRLFEAAACGTPIISDYWDGLETFFSPGEEILISRSSSDTVHYLDKISEEERRALGKRARERILRKHTAAHRAEELENYAYEILPTRSIA